MGSSGLPAVFLSVALATTSSPAVEETPIPPPPPELQSAPEPDDDGPLARPVPAWKWTGLGFGIGITVTGIVTGTVGFVLLGKVRDDVFDAATDSVNDCIDPMGFGSVPCEGPEDVRNDANDVDPNMAGDLCSAGRSNTDALGIPIAGGAVRNAAVSDACAKGDKMRNVSIAGFAVMGVGLVATAVFTALLFVPRKSTSKAAAALRRRRPTLGFTPAPGGGMVGGGFRF
jgi:hypothetical protein